MVCGVVALQTRNIFVLPATNQSPACRAPRYFSVARSHSCPSGAVAPCKNVWGITRQRQECRERTSSGAHAVLEIACLTKQAFWTFPCMPSGHETRIHHRGNPDDSLLRLQENRRSE